MKIFIFSTPYTPTNYTAPAVPDVNILWSLSQFISTLKKKGTDPSTTWGKIFVLRMLVHNVGDIHNPIHGATLFDATRFPKGDQGGNLFTISYNGTKSKITNLHAFWDSGLFYSFLLFSFW